MNDAMRKRLTDNFELTDYKEHVAEIAAALSPKCPSYQDAVNTALLLIDEVDQQVDKAMQETPGKAGL